MIRSVFTATGSYIPDVTVRNQDFLTAQFYTKEGAEIPTNSAHTLTKFQEITGICERRYARPEQKASELGFLAASDALTSSGIDPETLDYIIVAHNFGDVAHGSNRVDMVPSLASRIKALLHIKNPDTIAYDMAFGCPGWLEGIIQANYYIRSGDAKRCLVIGTETLSRVIDPHDRDSMLFSDGSGAVILEASDDEHTGILSHHTQTHAHDYATLLNMSKSYAPTQADSGDVFMKMNGRKLYEFALNQVPLVIKKALDKAGISLSQINKVLIHQANEKMDVAILQRLYKLYNLDSPDLTLMPMTISWLGNSSVATIPTLLDLIQKGKFDDQQIKPGDKVVIASVGAGMNINSVIYQF
ncbi:3-oxoacyl-ACP synthase III family protein [Spirosoma agri]|uniref:Ketoacyl-ACP synthase III n=1 Tax=Spirosoma agri TaxID=1987381 RepID=A0A6M0IGZ9_9BACT|nr:ketoacyl-ACP synthase III [Spirosoma agri]NEU66965.1 ketoacyl-ACP synthase III [Spirosoma agri]